MTGTSQEMLSAPTPGQEYVVLDDFLPPSLHQGIWAGFATTAFERLRFGLIAPETLRGPTHVVDRAGQSTPLELAADTDQLIRHVLHHPAARAFLDQCGDWDLVDFRRYIYPAGSGINWHLDSAKAAAFIYYAHPVWHLGWGGELLVAAGAMRVPLTDGRSFTPAFYAADNTFETSRLLQEGVAHCVFPKPNRLVLLRGGTPHILKSVDPSIGDGFRASVSGFFVAVAAS